MVTKEEHEKFRNSLREHYRKLGLKKGEIDPVTGLPRGIIHVNRLPNGQRLPDIENGKIVEGTGTYVPEPESASKS
jgi:hypothetical protein